MPSAFKIDRTKCPKINHYADNRINVHRCGKPAEERYDRHGIYAGVMCDSHWENSGMANWQFDPMDAGESLEPEDY